MENGSMSVSSHVQAEVSCGQPHFMNANTKKEFKNVIKTLLTSDNCLSQESLFISAPGILKINGFCTDTICCQD